MWEDLIIPDLGRNDQQLYVNDSIAFKHRSTYASF